MRNPITLTCSCCGGQFNLQTLKEHIYSISSTDRGQREDREPIATPSRNVSIPRNVTFADPNCRMRVERITVSGASAPHIDEGPHSQQADLVMSSTLQAANHAASSPQNTNIPLKKRTLPTGQQADPATRSVSRVADAEPECNPPVANNPSKKRKQRTASARDENNQSQGADPAIPSTSRAVDSVDPNPHTPGKTRKQRTASASDINNQSQGADPAIPSTSRAVDSVDPNPHTPGKKVRRDASTAISTDSNQHAEDTRPRKPIPVFERELHYVGPNPLVKDIPKLPGGSFIERITVPCPPCRLKFDRPDDYFLHHAQRHGRSVTDDDPESKITRQRHSNKPSTNSPSNCINGLNLDSGNIHQTLEKLTETLFSILINKIEKSNVIEEKLRNKKRKNKHTKNGPDSKKIKFDETDTDIADLFSEGNDASNSKERSKSDVKVQTNDYNLEPERPTYNTPDTAVAGPSDNIDARKSKENSKCDAEVQTNVPNSDSENTINVTEALLQGSSIDNDPILKSECDVEEQTNVSNSDTENIIIKCYIPSDTAVAGLVFKEIDASNSKEKSKCDVKVQTNENNLEPERPTYNTPNTAVAGPSDDITASKSKEKSKCDAEVQTNVPNSESENTINITEALLQGISIDNDPILKSECGVEEQTNVPNSDTENTENIRYYIPSDTAVAGLVFEGIDASNSKERSKCDVEVQTNEHNLEPERPTYNTSDTAAAGPSDDIDASKSKEKSTCDPEVQTNVPNSDSENTIHVTEALLQGSSIDNDPIVKFECDAEEQTNGVSEPDSSNYNNGTANNSSENGSNNITEMSGREGGDQTSASLFFLLADLYRKFSQYKKHQSSS